jgi:HEPN domain-containing protein
VKNYREEWQRQSQYDLDTAEAMYDSGRYIYAVFMVHLAVEKALKGLCHERKQEAPPKIHNLLRLCDLMGLALEPDREKFFGDLTAAQIETRYPEELLAVLGAFNKQVAREQLDQARESIAWIAQQ